MSTNISMTAQPVSTTTGEVATLLKLPEPLRTLQVCSEHGWLRRLDSAMACFVAEQDPAAHPALLVAVALATGGAVTGVVAAEASTGRTPWPGVLGVPGGTQPTPAAASRPAPMIFPVARASWCSQAPDAAG